MLSGRSPVRIRPGFRKALKSGLFYRGSFFDDFLNGPLKPLPRFIRAGFLRGFDEADGLVGFTFLVGFWRHLLKLHKAHVLECDDPAQVQG